MAGCVTTREGGGRVDLPQNAADVAAFTAPLGEASRVDVLPFHQPGAVMPLGFADQRAARRLEQAAGEERADDGSP